MADIRPSPPVHNVRRTLAAGANGVTVIEVPGVSFRIKEADGPISIKIDESGAFELSLGMAYTCPAGTGFRQLEIQNLATTPNRIEIMVAQGTITDDRLNVVHERGPLDVRDAAADLVSAHAGDLAAGASVVLAGPAFGAPRRRAVQVTNGSVELRLQLRNAAGAVCGLIFPEQCQVFPISGPCSVHNPHGAAVECYVAEILWSDV